MSRGVNLNASPRKRSARRGKHVTAHPSPGCCFFSLRKSGKNTFLTDGNE